MSSSTSESQRDSSHSRNPSHASSNSDSSTATVAPFSPSPLQLSVESRPQSVLIQQNSPLLIATPPQITRTLAYSYPFIRPLNKLVGLISWTSHDPWQSFLLVAAFWAVTLYADLAIRWAGPLFALALLMICMYARRFSSLSSNEWTGEKRTTLHKRTGSQANAQHSLEEVVENLKVFTSRCNILLDPLLRLTDFLSTQTSATSATTRPALMAMLWRIGLVTPTWFVLGISPIRIITFRRVVMAVGTTILTWHSQPARVTRTIFWRSRIFRKVSSMLTGLDLTRSADHAAVEADYKTEKPHSFATTLATKADGNHSRIRLTFTLYENQRRWIGLGWTHSLMPYERSPWTDEHLNSTEPKDKFKLPEVSGGHAFWQWAEDIGWHVVDNEDNPISETSDTGWVFYDNKWEKGRDGKDGWGRYTRRRKWCRDAEMIEVPYETNGQAANQSTSTTLVANDSAAGSTQASSVASRGRALSSSGSSVKGQKPVSQRRPSQSLSDRSVATSFRSTLADAEDDYHVPMHHKETEVWRIADDAAMNIG